MVHKPSLLSDNGSSYIATDLADWLHHNGMQHVHGAPYHPQTQGKIERWHQTLKNRILLENYLLLVHLELKIGNFVSHYNHHRYHGSLNNLTPADVYFGRGQAILLERARIKRLRTQISSNEFEQFVARADICGATRNRPVLTSYGHLGAAQRTAATSPEAEGIISPSIKYLPFV